MGTKMVTYKEGMFVLFKAVMDNQLAAALQPYFQEETGFHWQELLKMPRPPLMTDFVNGQRYDKVTHCQFELTAIQSHVSRTAHVKVIN